MLTISKRVQEGDAVVRRGQKVVRAGRRNKRILGVWTWGGLRTTLTPAGTYEHIRIPSGVVVEGYDNVARCQESS